MHAQLVPHLPTAQHVDRTSHRRQLTSQLTAAQSRRYKTSDAPAAVKPADSTDPTFGTEDNTDTCQRALADVEIVYLDTCPEGGAPIPKYGQCGGADWDGATCCFGYSACVAVRPLPACCALPFSLLCVLHGHSELLCAAQQAVRMTSSIRLPDSKVAAPSGIYALHFLS